MMFCLIIGLAWTVALAPLVTNTAGPDNALLISSPQWPHPSSLHLLLISQNKIEFNINYQFFPVRDLDRTKNILLTKKANNY